MKTLSRFSRLPAHVPPARTPFQDYVATQRRMAKVERVGKFAVALVVVLAAVGYFGK